LFACQSDLFTNLLRCDGCKTDSKFTMRRSVA